MSGRDCDDFDHCECVDRVYAANRRLKQALRNLLIVSEPFGVCPGTRDEAFNVLRDAPDFSDWALVPVEPTKRMLAKGWRKDDASLRDRYRAMIAAAPKFRPTQEQTQ